MLQNKNDNGIEKKITKDLEKSIELKSIKEEKGETNSKGSGVKLNESENVQSGNFDGGEAMMIEGDNHQWYPKI